VVVQFDEPSLQAAVAGRLTGVTALSPVAPIDETLATNMLDICAAAAGRRGVSALLWHRSAMESIAAQQY